MLAGCYNGSITAEADGCEVGPSIQLMEHVRHLEGRSNAARGDLVLAALKVEDIKPSVQKCRWPKIRNVIVDFSSGPRERRLLFSAHYDARKGSPAANDNASGVAVLLGLCHELRQSQAPVRVVFFDREEAWLRTPMLRLGLLGSLLYVIRSNPRAVSAVYNLEFCGQGEHLAVWPVRGTEVELPAVRAVGRTAAGLSLPFSLAHIPWPFMTSDHLSFRLRGMANAVTLSLLPASQVPVLRQLLTQLSLPSLLRGRRPALPEPLSFIHSAEDTSSRLSEESLRLMLSVLLELVRTCSPSLE